MNGFVQTEIDAEGNLTLWLDAPGKSVNTLSRAMWSDLNLAIDQVERDRPRSVTITSAKNRSFIAGADLFEMRDMTRPQLEAYLREGQRILNRIEALPMPTIAAINGDALGGGLEVALACKHRIAASESNYKIGLPEATLGLCPGWGGTVRLARLIGVEAALPLLQSGKVFSSGDALKLGVVDELAPSTELVAVAKRCAERARPKHVVAQDVFESVRPQKDNPAANRIVSIVREGIDKGFDAGLDAEVTGLCDLRETPEGRNLMHVFFLRQSAKKSAIAKAGGAPTKVEKCAVIGGGTMGAGIAHAMLKSKLPVVLVEADESLARKAHDRIKGIFDDDVKGARTSGEVADAAMARLTCTTDLSKLADADVIVEAVIEQMDAKRDLWNRIDRVAKTQAVLATNTSSLSVTEMSQFTSRPSRFVGLHFFNPVPRMALVEVARAKQSDPVSVATAVALAAQLGKTPVLVNDGVGFIVNRVLFPYLSAAMSLVCEGVAVDAIESAAVEWGMPMGPLALIDTIGLDVTLGICRVMHPKLGARVTVPTALEAAVSRGWLGRKSGSGFFVYSQDRKAKPTIHAELISLFSARDRVVTLPVSELQDRLMRPMADEAMRVLDEGICDSTDDIDTATLLGIGFPAFRGGLGRWSTESRNQSAK